MTKTIERRGGPAANMRRRDRRNRTTRAPWLALRIITMIGVRIVAPAMFFGLLLLAWFD